jgi:hypothetical protein
MLKSSFSPQNSAFALPTFRTSLIDETCFLTFGAEQRGLAAAPGAVLIIHHGKRDEWS